MGQPRLLVAKGRSSGAVFSLILYASSWLPDAQPGWPGVSEMQSTRRKEAEAAGAEINTVLLSTGRQPHQTLPHTPPSTKPMERCSWSPRARAVETERGVEVQEVGSGGGEHPGSWELPGR